MTPSIESIKRNIPDAEITVVVRKGTESILDGCPFIDHCFTTAAPEKHNRSFFSDLYQELRLLLHLRAQKFDYAIDLGLNDRGITLVALSGARFRAVNDFIYPVKFPWKWLMNRFGKSDWSLVHRAVSDFLGIKDIIPLKDALPGPLVYHKEKTVMPDLPLSASKKWIVLHPGTRWKRKQWQEARWVEIGRQFCSMGFQVVISAGPDLEEKELAGRITRSLGSDCVNTAGQLTWAELAGLLYRAVLFVGVDTAAMHLAAACGTPSVALFGPTLECEWRPWQVRHEVVAGSVDFRCRSMDDITVEQVMSASQRMLKP